MEVDCNALVMFCAIWAREAGCHRQVAALHSYYYADRLHCNMHYIPYLLSGVCNRQTLSEGFSAGAVMRKVGFSDSSV